MKYTNEITKKLVADYGSGIPVSDLATELGVPDKSVIAKLSSLGVYKTHLLKFKSPEPYNEISPSFLGTRFGIGVNYSY